MNDTFADARTVLETFQAEHAAELAALADHLIGLGYGYPGPGTHIDRGLAAGASPLGINVMIAADAPEGTGSRLPLECNQIPVRLEQLARPLAQ